MRKLRPLLKLYIIIIAVRDIYVIFLTIILWFWELCWGPLHPNPPSSFWLCENLRSDVVDLVKIYIRKRIWTHGRTLDVIVHNSRVPFTLVHITLLIVTILWLLAVKFPEDRTVFFSNSHKSCLFGLAAGLFLYSS